MTQCCRRPSAGPTAGNPSTHPAVLEEAIKDRAVGLAHGPQVEAPHLRQELVLVLWGHAGQEVDVVCRQQGTSSA